MQHRGIEMGFGISKARGQDEYLKKTESSSTRQVRGERIQTRMSIFL